MQGVTESLVLAELQTRIRALAQQSDAVIVGAQELPRRDVKGQIKLGMRLQIQTSIEGAVALLHGIEAQTPILMIERIAVAAAPSGLRAPDGAERLSMLTIAVDVFGSLLPRAS